jgi:hypothetical protein
MNPHRNTLLVSVCNTLFDEPNVFDIGFIVIPVEQRAAPGPAVGREKELPHSESLLYTVIDQILKRIEMDPTLRPVPPGVTYPEERRSVGILEVAASTLAFGVNPHKSTSRRIGLFLSLGPCRTREFSGDAVQTGVLRPAFEYPLTGRGWCETCFPGRVTVPEPGHGYFPACSFSRDAGEAQRYVSRDSFLEISNIRISLVPGSRHFYFVNLPLPDFG